VQIADLVCVIVYGLEAVEVNQPEKSAPVGRWGLRKFHTNQAGDIPLKKAVSDLLEEFSDRVALGPVRS